VLLQAPQGGGRFQCRKSVAGYLQRRSLVQSFDQLSWRQKRRPGSGIDHPGGLQIETGLFHLFDEMTDNRRRSEIGRLLAAERYAHEKGEKGAYPIVAVVDAEFRQSGRKGGRWSFKTSGFSGSGFKKR